MTLTGSFHDQEQLLIIAVFICISLSYIKRIIFSRQTPFQCFSDFQQCVTGYLILILCPVLQKVKKVCFITNNTASQLSQKTAFKTF